METLGIRRIHPIAGRKLEEAGESCSVLSSPVGRIGGPPLRRTGTPAISLNKVSYENFHGRVLFHTSFNEYFKENLKLFEAPAFIALLTQHLPKKGVHHIRRYALGGPGLLIPQPRYLDRKALRSGTRAGWTRRPRW